MVRQHTGAPGVHGTSNVQVPKSWSASTLGNTSAGGNVVLCAAGSGPSCQGAATPVVVAYKVRYTPV
jgi:hypothetical protein